MPGYGPGDGYGGMDGFGNSKGSPGKGGGADAGTPGGGYGMGVGPDGVGAAPGGLGDTGLARSGVLGSEKSGIVQSKYGPVTTPRSLKNALSQQQRSLARKTNALQMNAIRSEPSLSMSDYSPSTMGGLNATDGLSFGESMGYNMAGIKDAIGNMGITKGGIMGSAIAAMLGLGPLAGIALGQIGKSYSDKPEGEPGFFGQLGQNVRSDLSSMFGKAPEGEKRSLMDRLGLSGLNIGPADPNVDDKGGNREPVMQELATMDVATIERDNIIKEYIAKGYPPDMAEYLYEALHANA